MLRRRDKKKPFRKPKAEVADETVMTAPTNYRGKRMKPPYEDANGKEWPFVLAQGDRIIRPHMTRRAADRDAAELNRLDKEQNRFGALINQK